MADLGLQSFNKLYPMLVKKYKNLNIDQNADIPDKINQIVNQLNALGKLSNDVVRDWNTVYNWCMNDGLSTDLTNAINSGKFDSIVTTLFNNEIGDLTTLQTTDKGTVVEAINDNVASLAQKVSQVNGINPVNGNVTVPIPDVSGFALSTDLNQKANKSYLHLNVKDYGAKGDGVTDDTSAIQSFINDVTSQHRVGIMPSGTYIISSEISIPSQYGWAILGSNGNSTIIKQNTDNISIFHFSSTPSYMYGVQIRGINFSYLNSQPSTNTSANPMYFETMAYECIFDDLVFTNGAYGIYVKDTVGNPWGCTFDNLRFSTGLTIGAIRMSTSNGVPNNHLGRIFCDCTNMIGPVFNLKGYNSVIDTIEFIAANQGAELMYFQAGAIFEIGALKIENGIYTTGGKYLFELSTKCKIHIGSINVGGSVNMTLNPSSGSLYLIGSTGGTPYANVTIGHVDLTATNVANTYVFGNIGPVIINSINIYTTGFALSNVASTTGCETIVVNQHLNNHLAQNKGDADYTVALGDPNIFTFDTVLTAPRTVTLPTDTNNMFNGLKYTAIVSNAVATATNTITFKAGTLTLATVNTGKVSIEFTWRRNATAQNGWVVTGYSVLP